METFIKQLLPKITHPFAFTTIFVLLVLGGFAVGQKKVTEEKCKDKQKTTTKNQKITRATAPQIINKVARPRVENRITVNRSRTNWQIKMSGQSDDVVEKSILVHPKVYLSLCVLQGKIKVNGWKRDEVRAFVKSKKKLQIGFKIRERDYKEKKPVWVQILGYNPKENDETNYNTCLSGEIELDVPENASITIENNKGQSETTIDSVRVAKVEVLGGDIYLNNISDRIDAQTYQGGVTVRNSSGKMFLSTTSGNIIAHNTFSSEIGDYFKAKTRSGAITLQSVEQKEVESSSISGSINYIGTIKPFGQYGFNTTNGSINLAIPINSSCQIIAAYGGSFQSELPLSDIFKERTESLVFLKGRIGKGEANLNLKSFNGTISIREKKESVLAGFEVFRFSDPNSPTRVRF